ncbi:unknown protein (plasmid) [[Synechococcus] sp. NIES-970]|uniref:helix-turn-helix domain-containing protein n=1 Tax=Picosynechococcus sp. NKBG15041c TaxID=1407650 RepID=UPI000465F066|nr:helix-turn-helix transcriptional regulator [Picosynechococcus sp. NKBG15041c]MBV5261994.1 helix-turn-helix transcriptional regulator [Synechococcus moorigangaii CMS01]BAW97986.1 unknown protein [[Synechococcus] sp. NIES-970]
MGSVSRALKQVLETHGVSQYRIAKVLEIERNTVYRWVKGAADPSGETIADIVTALQQINPAAAEDFVYQYLGEILDQREKL